MLEFYKDIDIADLGRMCAMTAKMMENLYSMENTYEQGVAGGDNVIHDETELHIMRILQ